VAHSVIASSPSAPDTASGDAGASLDPEAVDREDVVVWRAGIPLLTNRFMLKDFGVFILATVVVMQLALGLIGLFAGEGFVTLPWPVYAGIVLVFVVGFAVVALVFYQNRFHAQFAVGPNGIVFESGQKERTLTRATILAGLLTLTPSAAGAGMLASAREVTVTGWDEIDRIRAYPRQRVIALGNSWRTLVRLYCTPENYPVVSERVQSYLTAAALGRERPVMSPSRQIVLPVVVWVGLVVLGGVMTRAWSWASDDTELVALLAVALLIPAGLVGRTGWVLAVPSGALAMIALLVTIGNALEESASMFGGTYRLYEFDTGSFWLTLAGYALLIVLAVLVLFGFGPARWRQSDTDSAGVGEEG
jgi:hypothetical protein